MPTPPVDISAIDKVWRVVPGHWPLQGDVLNWCQNMGPLVAAMLVIAGIIYLLFGYFLYRFLIVLNFSLVAALLGWGFGHHIGSREAGAILAGFTAAAVAWPLMKYTVAILGGLYGAALGATIWQSAGLQQAYIWSGAATGCVFFGLLSFLLFRGCVIIYTAMQGSVMFVFGVLGLIYKYPDIADNITRHLELKPVLLPIAIFIPAVIGLMFQQSTFPPPAPAKK